MVEDYDYLEDDTLKDRFLTFRVSEEHYGIEIRFVREIIGIQGITPVPELPVHIKGIINLRGLIIPVMDVRLRLKKAEIDYNDRTCIIVVDIDGMPLGLIVDSVSEVLSIPEDKISAPPASKKSSSLISGIGRVGEDVRLIIDSTKLMDDEEADELNAAIKVEEGSR